MPRSLRRAVGPALCALVAVPLVCGAAQQPPPATCDSGTTGPVAIVLQQSGGECVVKQPIAAVCVERGRPFQWRITNESCPLDQSRTAVEFTQPEQGGKPAWKYEGCTPRKNGIPVKQTVPLECRVPKTAAPGIYKYGVKGQVRPIDPDIEVRPGT